MMSGYFLNASICVALCYLSGGTFGVLIDEVVMTGIGQPALLACPFSSTTRDFARATWAREVRLSHQTQRHILASVAQCQNTKIISCNISRINPEKYALGGTLTEGLMMMIQQVDQYDEGVYLCTAVLRSSVTERRIRLDIAIPPTEVLIYDVNNSLTLIKTDLILHVVSMERRSLSCTVPSPCDPPAILTWFVGDVHTSLIYNQTNWPAAGNTSLMTSSRRVDVIPTIDDDRRIISCLVEHPGMSDALRIGVILRVGYLPCKPSNVAVLKSSITTSSFSVIWQNGSSDGNPKTFNVECCKVDVPLNCTEFSNVTQTRLTIGDLRPSTSYRVCVQSQNVFGFSEVSESIEIATKPLSPEELGIKAVYDSQENRVDITRPDSTGGPLPFDLCFQLVNTTIAGDSVDPDHAEVSIDCVSVDGAVPIPRGWSLKNVKVLSFQNGVYSFPSKIYFNGEKQGLPGKPNNVSVLESSITSTSFSVAWQTNSSDGRPETYTVTYCKVDVPEECTKISELTHTQLSIDGLRPCTVYRVTVQSKYVSGFSEDSEFIEILTQCIPSSDNNVIAVVPVGLYLPISVSVAVVFVLIAIIVYLKRKKKQRSRIETARCFNNQPLPKTPSPSPTPCPTQDSVTENADDYSKGHKRVAHEYEEVNAPSPLDKQECDQEDDESYIILHHSYADFPSTEEREESQVSYSKRIFKGPEMEAVTKTHQTSDTI